MAKKLFILGRPGSGKSAAFRHIEEYIKEKYGWSAIHYNDYKILKEMFLFEKLFHCNDEPRKFRATDHNGFDVIHFPVLDLALRDLEKNIRHRYSSNKDELIVIEFARDDYVKALELFSPSFLNDAYFLFLDADIKTCISRVHRRVAYPTSEDDHFVSEDIIRSYYSRQTFPHGIDKGRARTITNKRSLQEFFEQVDRFLNNILAKEPLVQVSAGTVSRRSFHLSAVPGKMLTSLPLLVHQKVK